MNERATNIRRALNQEPTSEVSESHVLIPPQERANNELRVREFSLPEDRPEYFTEEYKSILGTLTQAARRTALIYQLQEGESDRANFYPKGITKKAMREAIAKNPDLGSPYSIVGQDQDGELVPVWMHDVYRPVIQDAGILELLDEAAGKANRLGDNQLFEYLNAKINALQNGDYEESDKVWLEMNPEPIVDIVIGPYDRYTDKFLGKKYSYQAWAGYLDREKTYEYQNAVNEFLQWWETTSGEAPPKVRMRIDHTKIMAGQAAKEQWSGNSLPCQPEWRQKYGSKFTIFEPALEDVFKKRLAEFRRIIDTEHRKGVTDEMVANADLKRHLFHEISHSLGIPVDIDDRLENATWLRELRCDLMALVGYMNLESATPKQKELAIASLFANGVLDYRKYRDDSEKYDYHVARSIVLGRMVTDGGVGIKDGKLFLTDGIFDVTEELFSEVEDLHKSGTTQQIEKYFRMSFRPEIYRPIAS